jgi:hypothetical protein
MEVTKTFRGIEIWRVKTVWTTKSLSYMHGILEIGVRDLEVQVH